MSLNGMQVVISRPYKVYRTEYRPVKKKGPRKPRLQRVKIFDHWQEMLKDGEIVGNATQLYMNQKTFNLAKQKLAAQHEHSMPQGFGRFGL